MKKIILVKTLIVFFLFARGHDCYAGKAATYYTIHGASYQKLDNAINNINELKVMGYESYYKKVNISGKGIWYRVYIGRYADRDEALKIARKLEVSYKIDTFTLQEYVSQGIAGVSSTGGGKNIASNSSVSRTSKGKGENKDDRSNILKDKASSHPTQDVTVAKDSKRGKEEVKSSKAGDTAGKTRESVPVAVKSSPPQPDKISLPAADKSSPEGSLYETAMRHFDAGQYEQALDALKELSRQKLDAERKEKVLMRLADCYYFLGVKGGYRQFLTAVDYYKDLLGRYPDPKEGNAIVYYRLALCYENLKFYYEALWAFENLILKYPDSPYLQEATFKDGMMLRETRKFVRAIEKLSAYLKKSPEGTFARSASFSIGDCYYQMRQKDNAEAWYGYVQKKWPASGDILFRDIPKDALRNFGNHTFQMRRFADAVDIFSHYMSLYPNDEYNRNVLYNTANSYTEMNQFPIAVKLFSLLIERYPETKEAKEAVVSMANIGVTNPDIKFPSYMAGIDIYKDPIRTYDSLLAKFPAEDFAERLLFQKGLALEAYGRNKEAFDTYVLLLKQFPHSKYQDESRRNLARNVTLLINKFYAAGDNIAVADLYFRVFAGGVIKNGDPDVMWKSGTSLKNIGLYEEAAIVFKDMARLPRDTHEEARLLLVLADLDRLRAKDDDAEEKLLGLLKRPAKDMEGLKSVKMMLADIYCRKKLYEKAIPLYAEAFGSSGDIVEGAAPDYLNYAIALREKNMLAPAVKNYQITIQDYNRNEKKYSPDVAANAYSGLGDSLYQEKKYQEGVTMYQQSLTVARDQNYKWWSLYHVGQGYTKLNNTLMAEKTFNQLKESGKEGFWEKVSDYWQEDNKWYEKNIRHLK